MNAAVLIKPSAADRRRGKSLSKLSQMFVQLFLKKVHSPTEGSNPPTVAHVLFACRTTASSRWIKPRSSSFKWKKARMKKIAS
jgi:hypothetical protein